MILFVQIGGTIDKDYPQGDTHHGYEFQIGDPGYLNILKRARLVSGWNEARLLQKDSLDMTDADREAVRNFLQGRFEGQVILTHGTDTIKKTAEVVAGITSKTIILTGAILPEKFRDSDADFNLGMAVGSINHLPRGVYIALHGCVVPWDEYES